MTAERIPWVYVAHPVSTYGSAHARRQFGAIGTLLPDATLINPATTFTSTAHWLAQWPELVLRLDAVIAFAAEDGTIGAGVARELLDAQVVGAGTAVLDEDTLRQWRGVLLLPLNLRTPARVGRLITGRRVVVSAFVSAS